MNVSWVRSSASALSRTMLRMYRAITGRYCSSSPVGGGVQCAMLNNLSQNLIGVCDQFHSTEAISIRANPSPPPIPPSSTRLTISWGMCLAKTSARLAADELHGLWRRIRSEEHTSELQSRRDLVCRLLLE